MRIAHVITRMIVGGAQENTLLNCRDLVELYQDDVLLITGPALGPEGDLLADGRGAGVPLSMVPALRRPIHPWRDAVSYIALKRILRRFRPQVVHTHSAKGGLLGRRAARALGVPAIIHTVHGAPFHGYQSRGARAFMRACERYAAGDCDRLVSVADAMTEQLVAAGVAPREKFVTVYSGMDVEPFLAADAQRDEVRRRLGFEDDHLVFGKIARLFHLKGHQYLIEAAEAAVRAEPRIRFLLVGDGILRERHLQQIRRRGLERYFVLAGLVPPQQIPELLGAMDVLVHCSLREGLARALPQALIAGKPVISYDVDGAREVVLPGRTGHLLPPCSVAELTEAMLDLARHPQRRAQWGAAGRDLFTDQFRHQTMTRRLRALYEEILIEKGVEPRNASH